MKQGHWVTTYTGGAFSYTNPRVEDIDIRDIAWSLSNLCRWTGHTSRFYSVAQHSIMCAHELAKDKLGLHGLLHDATEAYIGDITYPLKVYLGSAIRELEDNIFNCIDAKFNLVWTDAIQAKVKVVDDRMLCTEALQLTKWDTSGSKRRAVPYQYKLPRWSRETTLQLFMENFSRWTGCRTEESLQPFFREMLDEPKTAVPS